MADTPEKKVKNKVTAMLNELGVWHYYPQAGAYGRAGIPDIIGILPGSGRMVAIEVKAGTNYGLTRLRERTLGEMQNAGAYVAVVNGDAAVAQVKAALKAIMRLGG